MGQFDISNGGTIKLVEDEDGARTVQINDSTNASFVTQTTLSMDDTSRIIDILRERFPEIQGPRKDDICYATQNRQDAVKRLAVVHDLILVVGSPNSSNSNRLRELAVRLGSQSISSTVPNRLIRHGFIKPLPLRSQRAHQHLKISYVPCVPDWKNWALRQSRRSAVLTNQFNFHYRRN